MLECLILMNPLLSDCTNKRENRKMKTQEIQETARDLLAGTVYDMEQLTAEDARRITDLLASQGYVLRVKPEFSLVYAVPEQVH